MINKYIIKPTMIEAIQFEYSKNGAMYLDEFCGDKLIKVRKERRPNSIAKAFIKTSMLFGGEYQIESIDEGDFILKSSIGTLSVCKQNEFNLYYELVNA